MFNLSLSFAIKRIRVELKRLITFGHVIATIVHVRPSARNISDNKNHGSD